MASFSAVESLNHPMHKLITTDTITVDGLDTTFSAGAGVSTHVDTRVVSLSVINALKEPSTVGLVVHRAQLDKCFTLAHSVEDGGKVSESTANSSFTANDFFLAL